MSIASCLTHIFKRMKECGILQDVDRKMVDTRSVCEVV